MLELAELALEFFGLTIRGVFAVIGAISELAVEVLSSPANPDSHLVDAVLSAAETAASSTVEAAADHLAKQKTGEESGDANG